MSVVKNNALSVIVFIVAFSCVRFINDIRYNAKYLKIMK